MNLLNRIRDELSTDTRLELVERSDEHWQIVRKSDRQPMVDVWPSTRRYRSHFAEQGVKAIVARGDFAAQDIVDTAITNLNNITYGNKSKADGDSLIAALQKIRSIEAELARIKETLDFNQCVESSIALLVKWVADDDSTDDFDRKVARVMAAVEKIRDRFSFGGMKQEAINAQDRSATDVVRSAQEPVNDEVTGGRGETPNAST